jgi:hypothetical protein
MSRYAAVCMYQVVAFDGSSIWAIDLPDTIGGKEVCELFISRHLPPKGAVFNIVNLETDRMVSYSIPAPAKRYQLAWQDLKGK